MDLLTEAEDRSWQNRFDIDLLAQRLLLACRWVRQQEALQNSAIGLFGASTGSAAALRVAAILGDDIAAMVSRGGRPDLAQDDLPKVKASTLLIVGGNDPTVLELNQKAFDKLTCARDLVIIEGATHLFEEGGALEQVAHHANTWFAKYLQVRRA